MSLSKKQLSVRLKRKTLNLNEKIHGCRKYGEIHRIKKTSAASILKYEENIRKKFKMFEGKHFVWNLIE